MPFPFPLITEATQDGLIKIYLTKKNYISENEKLVTDVKQMLNEGYLQVFLKYEEDSEAVLGDSLFDPNNFIRSNWPDNSDK